MIDFDSQKGDDAAGEGRSLTDEEIKVLVATPDARRIAVENFLGTMDVSLPRWMNEGNLDMDTRSYGWNGATVRAISKGIALAYKGV
jgi:hypothetical protein